MELNILGLVMLGCLFIAILLGFPISFTLVSLGMVFGFVGMGDRVFLLLTFQVFQTMQEGIMAAVALFLFMGYVMERAGLMTRFFRGFQILFGGMRGSLYLCIIFTALIFSAATGIVAASVTIVALIAAPHMIKSGYSNRMSAGIIAAGGTLGVLLPPSVMLLVISATLEVSIFHLFAGSIIPGLLLATLFLTYAMVLSYFKPEIAPLAPEEDRNYSMAAALKEIFFGIIPPAILILATLGSIFAGLATPTEGAALGALGAILIVIFSGKFQLNSLKEATYKTAHTTAMILFLMAAANFFSAVFSRFGSPQLLTEFLLSMALTPTTMMFLVLGIIFLIGWPLGCWVAIVVIFVPLFAPILAEMGISMLMFGILVVVTLQAAWLTPPIALSAYFLKAAVPQWQLKDIMMGMLPFMVLQLVGLIILVLFPEIIYYLPRLIYGDRW